MRLVLVRGFILPHLALAALLIAVVTVLPRYWKRFRVAPRDGRTLLAVAVGMPSIVLMLKWAIRVDLQVPRLYESTPLEIYAKWGFQAIVLLSIFLLVIVYVIRVLRVEDGFSFGVLWAIVISACLATLYFVPAPFPGGRPLSRRTKALRGTVCVAQDLRVSQRRLPAFTERDLLHDDG